MTNKLNEGIIKGYKVFEPGFICRDYDFQGVGTTHTYEGDIVLCESGFHFCTTLQDCFKYYNISPDMVICEVEAQDYTNAEEGSSKHSCKTLTIIRQMSLDEIIPHITDSEWAYHWAKNIGNADIMIDHVTNSYWAYRWARDIGNADIMIDRITNSEWAYWWARDIGNRDIMINRFPNLKERLA